MVESDKNKIAILKSLGTNFLLVSEWGYEPSKLILVVVESGQLKKTVDLLSDPDMPKLNALMNIKQLQCIFTNHTLTFAVYPYVPTRKNMEFLLTLSGIVRVGEVDGEALRSFPIVVTEGIPNGIDLQDYFTVYLNGNLESIFIYEDEIVPDDNQIPVVLDKMRRYLSSEKPMEERALLVATCFLYPNLVRDNNEEQFDKLIAEVGNMVVQDDENKDSNNLNEMFVQEMYDWQESTGFVKVYELPYLEKVVVEQMEQIILYDGNYLYMKERLFKEISKKLLRIFSVDILKRELLNAGILSSDKSKTYTVKVTYIDATGQYRRERMLRFDRKKMEILGDIEFVEQCIGRKEMN